MTDRIFMITIYISALIGGALILFLQAIGAHPNWWTLLIWAIIWTLGEWILWLVQTRRERRIKRLLRKLEKHYNG